MRRFLCGLMIAAAAVVTPSWGMAGSPNEDSAGRVAASLKESGKLQGYRIGVKFQDGTVWLKGEVASREQMRTALELVAQMPGVTRVVNDLTTASREAGEPSLRQPQSMSESSQDKVQEAIAQVLGKPTPAPAAQVVGVADRVPTSFTPAAVRPTVATVLQEPALATPRSGATVAEAAPATAVRQTSAPASAPTPVPNGDPLPMGQAGAPLPLPTAGPPMPVQGALPVGAAAVRLDQPHMPNYAWPGYAAYPNYAALTYPKQYSPTAWPYIGPFYPYPQVPLGWRKVTLEWHDGWWNLDFDDGSAHGPFSGLFRPFRRH